MSNSESNITIPVDLTNPGQFFACCGLLELADRLWPGAEGWFDESNFHIQCELPSQLATDLYKAVIAASLQVNRRCSCAELELRVLRPILLDWWRNYIACDADHLRTWSGRQVGLIGDTVQAIKSHLRLPRKNESLFDVELVVRKPNGDKVAPLGFDAGRVGTAQDLGSSADNLGQPIACCVWTEFLALVALQRFSLMPQPDTTFAFHAWREPLAPCIAAVAVRGQLPALTGTTGTFRLARRSGKGYYAFQPISLTDWRSQ